MQRGIFILFVGLFYLSCQENQPQYTLSRPEAGDRIIVVEEFSGVRCPNCPEGTKELENLRTLYNDQIIIVTIHAGDFAFKYPASNYDFTTPEGNALLQLLGNPIGYPSAVINRIPNPTSGSLQSFSSQWGSLISNAISQKPVVTLSLEANYDPSTRILKPIISMVPNQDLDQEIRITLLLKENHMIDWQSDSEVPQGVDSLYDHRNVLRKVITDPAGDSFAANALAFEKVEKTYSFTLPDQTNWWKEDDLWLVAFVTGASGEILQGVEKPLQP